MENLGPHGSLDYFPYAACSSAATAACHSPRSRLNSVSASTDHTTRPAHSARISWLITAAERTVPGEEDEAGIGQGYGQDAGDPTAPRHTAYAHPPQRDTVPG